MGSDASAATEPTSRLLWESCRRDPDPAAVRRALDGGADAALAVAAAAQHRIGPLLWRALGVAGARDALGADAVTLGAMSDTLRMEAALLIPRAVALAVRPLSDAGFQPVVFKGPTVAARYPEPGLRQMEDIDLLLPLADHRRALDTLDKAGWHVARAGGVGHYDTVLIHEQVPSLSLEVHYGLEDTSERVTALNPALLWSRRVPIDCAGTPAFGLSQADELVVLAAHAGKPFHGFTRLIWIADLAMIVGDAASRCRSGLGRRAGGGRKGEVPHGRERRPRSGAPPAGVDAPAALFPLPTHGWRGQALRQLLSVTWPLTTPELHRYRLNYALTDSSMQRVRSLFVLAGNWHGLQVRIRNKTDAWRRSVGAGNPRSEAGLGAQVPGGTRR